MTDILTADEAAPFDAEAAFLASFEAPEEDPKRQPEEAVTAAQDASETPREEDPEAPAEDDPELELRVGEETRKVRQSELARLVAADRETTTKSADLQAQAEKLRVDQERSTTALQRLIDKAEAKWKPFAEIDWVALGTDPTVDRQQFIALREMAQEALNERNFLTQELDATTKAASQERQRLAAQASQAALKELQDPEKGIPGFNQDLYGRIVAHAETYGVPRQEALAITSPAALRILHDAMLYREGSKAVEAKVEKVVNKATKTLKPGSGEKPVTNKYKEAMSTLARTGSADAAEAAFLASF